MALNLTYLASGAAAGSAGVFIPVSNLYGIEAAELGSGDLLREAKVADSLLSTLYSAVSTVSGLIGISATETNGQFNAAGQFTVTRAFTLQQVWNLTTDVVDEVPLPAAGTGKLTIAQVFPDAEIVTAVTTVSADGILIPNTVIAAVGGGPVSNVSTTDARFWFRALLNEIALNLSVLEQIPTRSIGLATGIAFPANYTGISAVTGLTAAELPFRRLIQTVYTFVVRHSLSRVSQRYEVV